MKHGGMLVQTEGMKNLIALIAALPEVHHPGQEAFIGGKRSKGDKHRNRRNRWR